jgi:hypothetical protein
VVCFQVGAPLLDGTHEKRNLSKGSQNITTTRVTGVSFGVLHISFLALLGNYAFLAATTIIMSFLPNETPVTQNQYPKGAEAFSPARSSFIDSLVQVRDFVSSFAWQLCFFSCNYNHYELSLVVVIFWDPFDKLLDGTHEKRNLSKGSQNITTTRESS